MMRCMKDLGLRWAALAALILLGGCATPTEPTQAELSAAWEAQNIVPQNYKNDLLAFMRTYLNDPTRVRDAQVSQPERRKVGPGERYVACVRYNARNSSGKYIGVKDSAAIFVGGKLDRFVDQMIEVRPLCRDAVLAPFPELERLQR